MLETTVNRQDHDTLELLLGISSRNYEQRSRIWESDLNTLLWFHLHPRLNYALFAHYYGVHLLDHNMIQSFIYLSTRVSAPINLELPKETMRKIHIYLPNW